MTAPQADIRKEIRFAVVLYGGVSLAVYISGVVRELLAMVRATAACDSDPGVRPLLEPAATGSMAVYRRLGALLNRPSGETPDPNTVYTRFVVDVISGASAGGLNGLYLAKALSHGRHLDHLRDLWLTVGDFKKLVLSAAADNPRSLLDGMMMLDELRKAFDQMDRPEHRLDGTAQGRDLPLVDDVQCFATTTDLRGLPLQLRLADRTVVENRHKHVYRFAFSSGTWTPKIDHFDATHNPDLAVAARSTSAFPAAFAPFSLADAETAHMQPSPGVLYPEYDAPDASTVFNPRRHAFADGGILNNKPFAHAITALGSRRGGKPSERRLLYVEPSPDVYLEMSDARTQAADDDSKPNFFSVVQAAFRLPSEQTIREDLEKVIDRNRTIERMNGVLADLPGEVVRHLKTTAETLAKQLRDNPADDDTKRVLQIVDPEKDPQIAANAFKESDVGDLVRIYGLGYGGYQRMNVASVTDDLARVIARRAGVDLKSDELAAVRAMVRTWRDLSYRPYVRRAPESELTRAERLAAQLHKVGAPPAFAAKLETRLPENRFLLDFDLAYRLRRLDFVLNKIDDLFCLDERGILLLNSFGITDRRWMTAERRQKLTALAYDLTRVYTMLRLRMEWLGDAAGDDKYTLKRVKDLPPALQSSESAVRSIGGEIDRLIRGPRAHRESGLAELLAGTADERDTKVMARVVRDFEAIDAIMAQVTARIRLVSTAASRWTMSILSSAKTRDLPFDDPMTIEPVDMLRFFYDHYEAVDRVTFPVFQESSVGQEVDIVSVVRVSPVDGDDIVKPASGKPGRRLGGESLGHFGGFISARWRAIDFLWGQLDGAERLIESLCMGSSEVDEAARQKFVAEAHQAILADDANVKGIVELENIEIGDKGAARYRWLRAHHEELLANTPGVKAELSRALEGALRVLERIVKRGGPGILGTIASKAGVPVIFLLQSLFDDEKERQLRSLAWLFIAAGGTAIAFGVYAFRSALLAGHLWTAVGAALGGIAAVGGGLLLGVVGAAPLYLRRKAAELFAKVAPGDRVTMSAGDGRGSP